MIFAIILAAGGSVRMKGRDKVQEKILGKSLWEYSYDILKKEKTISRIYLVVHKKFAKIKEPETILGGKTRFDSAKTAFHEIIKKYNPSDSDIVIFHNAANPFLTSHELKLCIQKAKKYGACIVGTRAVDTIKIIKNDKIIETLPRKNILQAQTPQAFQIGLLKKAYVALLKTNKKINQKIKEISDESMLIENIGINPVWIEASKFNKKITTLEDLRFFESFQYSIRESISGRKKIHGIATDSHEFDTKGILILGGVKIKSEPKLKADSDGDIVIHAVATALSQAISGGSLGTFATPLYKKGVTKSTEYLIPLFQKMKKEKYEIVHMGIHIEGKRPKIDPIVSKIKKSLAKIFKIRESQIGLTATSGENLTPFGRGEGIHCIAIADIESVSSKII